VSNPIQSKQIGAMPNVALPRFELTGRPTCNSSGSDGPKHGILSFGEPQLPTIRPSGFRDRRVTGVTRSGRQTSHNQDFGPTGIGCRERRLAT